eukprot:15021687-Alexandrium_andersonii.AAC.1
MSTRFVETTTLENNHNQPGTATLSQRQRLQRNMRSNCFDLVAASMSPRALPTSIVPGCSVLVMSGCCFPRYSKTNTGSCWKRECCPLSPFYFPPRGAPRPDARRGSARCCSLCGTPSMTQRRHVVDSTCAGRGCCATALTSGAAPKSQQLIKQTAASNACRLKLHPAIKAVARACGRC